MIYFYLTGAALVLLARYAGAWLSYENGLRWAFADFWIALFGAFLTVLIAHEKGWTRQPGAAVKRMGLAAFGAALAKLAVGSVGVLEPFSRTSLLARVTGEALWDFLLLGGAFALAAHGLVVSAGIETLPQQPGESTSPAAPTARRESPHFVPRSDSGNQAGWMFNVAQRFVLAGTALAIVAAILFTPRVQIIDGTVYKVSEEQPEFAAVVDWRTVVSLAAGFALAGGLLVIALANRPTPPRISPRSTSHGRRPEAGTPELHPQGNIESAPSGTPVAPTS